MKKGELSVNILIVAALALLILIILVVLLGKSTRNLDTGLDCVQKGGKCVASGTCFPSSQIIPEGVCAQSSSATYECCKLLASGE